MKFESIKDRFDIFSYPVYGFNLDGRRNIGSWTGTICTTMALTVMMTYVLIKLDFLMEGKNPLIAKYELSGYSQTSEEGIDFSKFKVAFYVEDYVTNEPKDDPSMVKLYGLIE